MNDVSDCRTIDSSGHRSRPSLLIRKPMGCALGPVTPCVTLRAACFRPSRTIMTFKAPDSLSEQIAHHLAERIIRGELKERERIQEQKVTQSLNVSRGSVREALLILERRHLIVILPRRGAQVTELTPHKVQSLYTLMMELYILLRIAVAERW